jgi:MYXO-CTERM domain-containing protein
MFSRGFRRIIGRLPRSHGCEKSALAGLGVAVWRGSKEPKMSRTMFAMFLAATLAAPLSANAQQLAQPMTTDAVPNAAGCKLQYGGGPLIQHVKVFDVFYNTGNPYKDMLADYYTKITQSAYFDWLTEYNTTNYKISRGSFIGTYEDSNSTTGSKTIDDSQIGSYLDGLINAGKIPAPDSDTIYQIYFPSNVSITLQGSKSCQVFCAYHNSYKHNGQLARYSVIPDITTGSCGQGCGGSTPINNLTDVSSHELIEAVTDPDGNSAWVDTSSQSCGEIGDICNGQKCSTSGTGKTACPTSYVVQLEWSNKNNACIAQDPSIMVNGFTVAASPMTLNVPAGGMATVDVTTTKTSGSSETVQLSAKAPSMSNLTTSFSPTSVMSDNGKSTLTITAAANAMVGSTADVTVTAMGTSAAPTATVHVTVTAPPDMAMAPPDMATPPNNGGTGGTGGGGNGGTGGGGGTGTGGNGGTGGTGGNGNHGGGGDTGCSMGGGSIAGSWAFAGLVLLALAFRRRRA